MNAEQTIDTAKSLQRVQNYLERLEVAKGYHKECIHAFIDKDGAEIPLLATDLKAILQQVAATHPTQQALDAKASQAQRVSLSNEQLEAGCKTESCDFSAHIATGFFAGVRYAERAHGITQEKQ